MMEYRQCDPCSGDVGSMRLSAIEASRHCGNTNETLMRKAERGEAGLGMTGHRMAQMQCATWQLDIRIKHRAGAIQSGVTCEG